MATFMDDSILNKNSNPKTLGDWVKNFRIKKLQMKRKLRNGGDLRVCAILTTALISAEEELRRKQQERFHKWTELQSKYGYFNNENNSMFNNNNSQINFNSTNNSCASEAKKFYDNSICQQTEDLSSHEDIKNNLWKYELSGLDDFMKNMCRSSCSVKN